MEYSVCIMYITSNDEHIHQITGYASTAPESAYEHLANIPRCWDFLDS